MTHTLFHKSCIADTDKISTIFPENKLNIMNIPVKLKRSVILNL